MGPAAWAARPARTLLLPEGAADMPGQQTCAPPVIVTLPAQLDAAAAEQAGRQPRGFPAARINPAERSM